MELFGMELFEVGLFGMGLLFGTGLVIGFFVGIVVSDLADL